MDGQKHEGAKKNSTNFQRDREQYQWSGCNTTVKKFGLL